MSIQEPAWLKRSRPCPFFSQGRCLFADSCNFLHDIKVRNAVNQPLPSTSQAKRPSFPPKPVFDPPSVVVNSASPRSVHLASPETLASAVQDSSRYSGLLSVLSDVIGPPTTPEDASRAISAIPSSFKSTAHGPTGLPLKSDLVASSFESASTVAHTETEQESSSYAELSSILQPDPEATLVDPFGYQTDTFFPEEDDEPVAEFLSFPDDAESADGDTTSYFVEDTETYVIASEGDDDEDTNEHEEEDSTVVVSNRQSTLSSFTGASLLASPRNSVFGESSVSSPIEDGAVDLLSPVQLSAKLRPFPIPSLGSKVKRGDSIDSGYADGNRWVGPLPFPRSPPRSFRSSVTFLSHSRRASRCSPALKDKRVSYSVGALRPSPHDPIEGIKEVESDGSSEHGSEDNEETAYTILDAYDTSPSEEQGENKAPPLQVNVDVVTEEKVEEDEVPAVMRSLRRYSPEHLHPTREYDLDSCNQPFLVSDDNVSFKTALSAQPSYEDLSDISKVSPVKQDSLLSSISGCSTPNTSVLSYYSDANEPLGHAIVGSHEYEPSYLVTTGLASQIDSTRVSEASASEQSSLPEEVAIDSNVLSTSASTDELQGLAPEKVVAAQEPLSRVFHFHRRSPILSPSVNIFHSLSSAKDELGYVPLGVDNPREFPPQKVVTPQERLSGAFHFNKHPPNLSPSAEVSHSPLSVEDASSSVCPGANDLQEFAPENVVATRERLPNISHYDRPSPKSSPSTESPYSPSSCKGVPGFAQAAAGDVQEFVPENVFAAQERLSVVLCFDKRSSTSSSSAESSRSPSLVKDVLSRAPHDADGRQSRLPANVVAPREHLSGVFYFDKHLPKSISVAESSHSPSSVQDDFSYAFLGASSVQEISPKNGIASEEYSPGVLRFDRPSPKSSSSAESSHSLSSVKDVLGYAPPGAGSGKSGSPVPSPAVSHGCLADCAATQPGQSLAEENSLGSDEVTECLDSEWDNFTQQLSFPLSPPFSPAEFVGHSILSGEDTSVLSEATVANLEEDLSNACIMPQQEEVQRMHSGSDLTEQVRPSQLPLVGPPDSDADFTLRRSRAASDLTVKGMSSPMTTPEGTPYVLRSPSLPLEQQGRSDFVQSLYDQYFDDGTPDDGSGSSSPAHKGTAPPDMSNASAEPSQEVYLQSLALTPHVFQRESSPCSDGKPSNSGTDSPRSETVLRPLLTGRRSFLRSSLAEFVSKANLDSVKEASSTRPSARLQAREIGSTMVPLGFRRHKPQPAARTQPSRTASQPLHTVLPASQLREVLRIRTDIAQEDLPPGCSSASQVSFTTRSPLPVQSMSAPPTVGLKQLHLSSIINKRSSILSTHSSSIASSILSLDHLFNSSTPHSPSVSSTASFSRNSLLSSSCQQIPEQIHHTLKRSRSNSPILQATDAYFAPQSSSTRHDSRSVSAPIQQSKPWRLSHYRAGSRNYTSVDSTRRFSRRTSTLSLSYAVDEEQELDEDDPTMTHPIQSNRTDDWTHPASVLAPPVHAIATPKPTLLFAIASDDVDQVRQVLESGEAGPNDSVGPQSALAFTLTNDKLAHKPEIIKALLAYGANPSALRNPTLNPAPRIQGANEPSAPPTETMLEGMDPATRYFIARADAAHTRQTSQLIYRSFFRPLTRVRYDVIGQDWALEQLFRVLSMHSQKLAVAPIVVLLCGPSGHGKSLLARKFGFLLDVPTHTVNMTTLQSTHDIWQSYSMSPYEEPSSCTLAEFLIENEGKRCVVVLDEIEKVEDQKALWSLLMPWELGRCSLEAGKRHVDARNVIWLATSNIGHELVFEYHENRAEPDERMSREDYLELTGILRPRVSHCLGASLVSRVTTVLPFVPFTLDEKKAISAEAVYTFAGDTSKTLSPQEVESLVVKALPNYQPSEGARSLHRAISSILVDMI